MNDYKKIVTKYVNRLGQAQAVPLGETAEFTATDKQELVQQLKKQYERNQILIWIATALWVAFFALAVYFALHYRDNLRGLAIALGGNLTVICGVMLALRRLWLDTSAMGALLAILPGLSPAEAAKAITSFYFNAIDSKQRADSKGAQPAPEQG